MRESVAKEASRRVSLETGLLLPLLAFGVLLAVIFWVQPRSMSYGGLRLLLNYSMPLVFAGLAQMCVILIGDVDLSIGSFIALVNCIAALWLASAPGLAVIAFLACVGAYVGMGALVHLRSLPSIVVTLGASFVWSGAAVLVLPRPGAAAPAWLSDLARSRPPAIPMPILVALIAMLVVHLLLNWLPYGIALRGAGSNPLAVRRAGWSLIRIRMTLYGAGAVFGILAGLALTGLNTTGDATVGSEYTLLSVAAVIVGGGQFNGGIVSAAGTVLGAFIMLLTGALLSFLDISTDWQLSLQGAILIAVLASRGFPRRRTT